MKKSLQHKSKNRLARLSRPSHGLLTRVKKGLAALSDLTGSLVKEEFRGQQKGIPNSIAYRGAGRRMRLSRSKYNPVQEDIKHGIA